ncbi:hypothetical protein Q5Y75_12895 [Ruegeria sp. 2205SS24-7]|nr:hypothetical protein [Ruegeria sp. 2205SS24-7]MDP5218120.1 hypothetical protein [Ruegeria sp. 2205SS24-7]
MVLHERATLAVGNGIEVSDDFDGQMMRTIQAGVLTLTKIEAKAA